MKKSLVFGFLLLGTIALIFLLTLAQSSSAVSELPIANQNLLAIAITEGDSPGWFSLIPPLVAIVSAFVLRQVIVALFLGIWVGGWIAYNLSLPGLYYGLLDTISVYVRGGLVDEERISISIFSLMIGGMVGIITKNGGTIALVNLVIPWARSPCRGQLATSILGIVIFFDDYANTLIVGNAMRPVTDLLRISREKLAYIVDSTAAPIASLGLVTTWIGYEVGAIGDAIAKIDGFREDAYSIFLHSLLYAFYPLLTIFFVFAVAITQRDFGPMYAAERRARQTIVRSQDNSAIEFNDNKQLDLQPQTDKPQRSINAIIPILVLLISIIIGLYTTGQTTAGMGASLKEIIGKADSATSLLWGSLLGAIAAAVLSIFQGILTLSETVDAWLNGMKSMLPTMVILTLAWGLSAVLDRIGTIEFLTSLLGDRLIPELLPTVVFPLSGIVAFATGSSWGTMAILMPLVVPLSWAAISGGNIASSAIFYSSISTVLAGAVWGDHCSPLSDTTILAAMASRCDPIDHVRTQLPYAIAVGLVALLVGTLPTGFGLPWWIALILGVAVLLLTLCIFGKKTESIN